MHSTHFIYGYMVSDHSDSEIGNLLPQHMHHPTDRISHTMAFVTTVVEHWLEREIAHAFMMQTVSEPLYFLSTN